MRTLLILLLLCSPTLAQELPPLEEMGGCHAKSKDRTGCAEDAGPPNPGEPDTPEQVEKYNQQIEAAEVREAEEKALRDEIQALKDRIDQIERK